MALASQKTTELLKARLQALDNIPVYIDGKEYKASQCYRYGLDPVHILFNTNCPRYLREQIEYIFSKYSG